MPDVHARQVVGDPAKVIASTARSPWGELCGVRRTCAGTEPVENRPPPDRLRSVEMAEPGGVPRRGPRPNWFMLPAVVIMGVGLWASQGPVAVVAGAAAGLLVAAFIWYRYRYRMTAQEQDAYDESAQNPTVPGWLFVGTVLVLVAFVIWLIVTLAAGGTGS